MSQSTEEVSSVPMADQQQVLSAPEVQAHQLEEQGPSGASDLEGSLNETASSIATAAEEEDGFCSTHQKKRRKIMLQLNPDNETWGCVPGPNECKMKVAVDKSALQKVNAERGAQVVVCASHGKKRSVRNMIQVGAGIYVCGPSEQCQMKNPAFDEGVQGGMQIHQSGGALPMAMAAPAPGGVPMATQQFIDQQSGQVYLVQQPGQAMIINSMSSSATHSPNASNSGGHGQVGLLPGGLMAPLMAPAPQTQMHISPPGSGSHTSVGLSMGMSQGISHNGMSQSGLPPSAGGSGSNSIGLPVQGHPNHGTIQLALPGGVPQQPNMAPPQFVQPAGGNPQPYYVLAPQNGGVPQGVPAQQPQIFQHHPQ